MSDGFYLTLLAVFGSIIVGFLAALVLVFTYKLLSHVTPKTSFVIIAAVSGAALYLLSLIIPSLLNAEPTTLAPSAFSLTWRILIGAAAGAALGLGLRKERQWADVISRVLLGALSASFIFIIVAQIVFTKQASTVTPPTTPIPTTPSLVGMASTSQVQVGVSSQTLSLLSAVSAVFGGFGGLVSYIFRRKRKKGGDEEPCYDEDYALS